MREFPAEVRDFTEAFVALQRARQEADYALDTDDYQQSDVLAYIASAELAIGQFEEADVEARLRCPRALQATAIVGRSG